MKKAFSSLCAIAALMLVCGAFSYSSGQVPSATPDPFITQITSSPAGGSNNAFTSFAGEISNNGRFVAIESNGDISTEKTVARNNADGNREIFLFDYAQRRIFQITDTKNFRKAPASPTPTPTPSASPTPTPGPTPADPAQVRIEISNNRPVVSADGRWIVFSSNAPTPGNFDPSGFDEASTVAFAADGNQEIFLYSIPATTGVDLSTGFPDAPFVDLTTNGGGTFSRITDTTASRATTPGAAGVLPFVADDNRSATVNDDASIIAFVSTRDLVAGGNPDFNPEIFIFRRSPAPTALTQVTSTSDVVSGGRLVASIFNESPSLSASGSVFAFISNANHTQENNDSGSGFGNAEVYLGSYNQTAATAAFTRQVTRTKRDDSALTVNLLSPGRRLSRDGSLIALESLATDPKANNTTNNLSFGIFVYNVAADTFSLAAPRGIGGGDFGFIHFPTFTDYDPSAPDTAQTVVFVSALNFKTDGTFPAANETSTGLNPSVQPQIFATRLPVGSGNTFTRLTNNPVGGFGGIRPLTSSSRTRIAFSFAGTELGGGNPDLSSEVFYLLSPVITTESAQPLSFFTGASEIPLPIPGASPSPAPSPLVGTVTGVAAGELTIVRAPVAFAPAAIGPTSGSETTRSPALPVELGGVSVSVNGAAAGLYFVSGSPTGQINFVVPIGTRLGIATVVVRKADGTIFRGSILIVAAQPDIFPDTASPPPPPPDNRAVIFNVTDPLARTPEPFNVTSPDGAGNLVATVLEVSLTGVRSATISEVRVTIVSGSGNTEITGADIVAVGPNLQAPGFDIVNFKLPASLAGAGDVKIIVSVTRGGTTFSSRPADTAPVFRIN